MHMTRGVPRLLHKGKRSVKYLPRSVAALFAFGLIALGAGPAPALQTPALQQGQQRLSGQYSGSVSDNALGTGTAIANFVGDGSGGLGGYFVFTFGSANYSDPTIAGGRDAIQPAWGAERGYLSGAFESTIASASCRFHYSAAYTPSDHALTGSYKAVNGCSGQTGSFILTQQCYYRGGRQPSVRHEGGGIRGC
jgi:hypothetical protein